MKATGIGLPEKRHYEIDIPEEDWPVPTVLPIPEREPVTEPEPALVPASMYVSVCTCGATDGQCHGLEAIR